MIKSLFSEKKLQYGNRILWDPIGLWVSTLALKKSGSNGELWPEDFEWGSSGFYFMPTKLKWDTVKALSWIIVEVVKSSVCWFVCLALLQSLFQFTWNLFRVAKLATPKTVWNFWGWNLEHGRMAPWGEANLHMALGSYKKLLIQIYIQDMNLEGWRGWPPTT